MLLLRRVRGNAAEEDALDSEERKARRVRQEIDSEVLAEREEQKRRRQRGVGSPSQVSQSSL